MSTRRLAALNAQRLRLENVSDDDIDALMNSAETDSEDDDDSVNDPDFDPRELIPELDEAIDECLQDQTANAMFDAAGMNIAEAVNISLNISNIDDPAASSTFQEGNLINIHEKYSF